MKFVLQYLPQRPENHNISKVTVSEVHISQTCRNTARSTVLLKK